MNTCQAMAPAAHMSLAGSATPFTGESASMELCLPCRARSLTAVAMRSAFTTCAQQGPIKA